MGQVETYAPELFDVPADCQDSGGVEHSDIYRIRDEVRKFRDQAAVSARNWKWAFYALIIVPSVTGIVGFFGEEERHAWLLYPIPCLLLVLYTALLFGNYVRALTTRDVAASDMAARIAIGEFGDDSIFELTSWPWRHLLPGSRSRDESKVQLRPTLRRIGSNLDWYLSAKRPLFRATWILKAILPAWFGLAAYLTWLGSAPDGVALMFWGQTLILFLCIVFARYREQVWIETLARHLIDALEG